MMKKIDVDDDNDDDTTNDNGDVDNYDRGFGQSGDSKEHGGSKDEGNENVDDGDGKSKVDCDDCKDGDSGSSNIWDGADDGDGVNVNAENDVNCGGSACDGDFGNNVATNPDLRHCIIHCSDNAALDDGNSNNYGGPNDSRGVDTNDNDYDGGNADTDLIIMLLMEIKMMAMAMMLMVVEVIVKTKMILIFQIMMVLKTNY